MLGYINYRLKSVVPITLRCEPVTQQYDVQKAPLNQISHYENYGQFQRKPSCYHQISVSKDKWKEDSNNDKEGRIVAMIMKKRWKLLH